MLSQSLLQSTRREICSGYFEVGTGITAFFYSDRCCFNINRHIGPLLTTEYLDKQVKTEEIDLSVDGQCPDSTLPVIPVNVETRTEKYRVYDMMVTHYFRPKEFIDHAVEYMKKRMIQSNLVIDEQKGEKILVSLEEASSYGNWTLRDQYQTKDRDSQDQLQPNLQRCRRQCLSTKCECLCPPYCDYEVFKGSRVPEICEMPVVIPFQIRR